MVVTVSDDEPSRLPIGMFDSGVGGLTVARSVIDLLPHEDVIYFGDWARCPYGPRARDEIKGFALEIMDQLVMERVKLLVIACNAAASSGALAEAKSRYEVPVMSVIEPGVRAAAAATRGGHVGLIGTEATVASAAYDEAMSEVASDVSLSSAACPRFVEFVESGDTASDELVDVAETYLAPLKEARVDTLILGCTHYPLLSGIIRYVMGDEVVLISSAEETANEVFARLHDNDLLTPSTVPPCHRFISSAEMGSFSELGRRFLGPEFTGVEFRPWED